MEVGRPSSRTKTPSKVQIQHVLDCWHLQFCFKTVPACATIPERNIPTSVDITRPDLIGSIHLALTTTTVVQASVFVVECLLMQQVDAVSTISQYPTSQSFVMYNPSGKMFERTTVLYTSTAMAIIGCGRGQIRLVYSKLVVNVCVY